MAVYNECYSLYCAIKYEAKAGSPWAGEMWQTGLRLIANTAGQYPVSAGRVEPESFAVQDSAASRETTNWSIAQGWSGVTVGGSTITDADVDDILSKIHDFATTLRADGTGNYVCLNAQYRLKEVRIYPMLKGGGSPFKPGKTATAPVIATAKGTSADGIGTNAMPPDTALAISLGTGSRGPSGKGRMFVGSLSTAVAASTGLVAPLFGDVIKGAASALINGIRDINAGAGMGEFFYCPVIYTRVPSKAGLNADTASVISLVRLSDEFDTQRRRDQQRLDTFTNGPAIV